MYILIRLTLFQLYYNASSVTNRVNLNSRKHISHSAAIQVLLISSGPQIDQDIVRDRGRKYICS